MGETLSDNEGDNRVELPSTLVLDHLVAITSHMTSERPTSVALTLKSVVFDLTYGQGLKDEIQLQFLQDMILKAMFKLYILGPKVSAHCSPNFVNT